MILEATEPLEIDIDGAVRQLDTGQTFDLPDEQADRAQPYIDQGFLKPVENQKPLEGLTEGSLVEWKSPIFGLLTGRVQMIPGDGSILVDHPLNDGTFGTAFIQIDWVSRIMPWDVENTTKPGDVSPKMKNAPQNRGKKNDH